MPRRVLDKLIAQAQESLEMVRELGITEFERDKVFPAPGKRGELKKEEVPLASEQKAEALRKLQCDEIGDCHRCKLASGRKCIVFGEGNPDAKVMFIGEGPGEQEDQTGRPFVGAAGQLLTKIIEGGMKVPRSSVYIANIVKCRPPGNRTPEPDEVASCIGFLEKQIDIIKPRVIVALGRTAANALFKKDESIMAIRGKWREFKGVPVMPTFHPAYLLHNVGSKQEVWDDIRMVLSLLAEEKE
jgi:uracil-DNA glycosylase